MDKENTKTILKLAEKEIAHYLQTSREADRIDEQSYQAALKDTFHNLEKWLEDPHIDSVSQSLKQGIYKAIEQEEWEDLINAFRQQVRFGTGGIRGMMAYDRDSIVQLKEKGIDTDILKGPNTINDLVFLLTSVGVARFGKDQTPPFEKVVIGYDSRIRGYDFSRIIAELFLAYDYTVYFFDEPCPYPEVTFAIPNELIKADIGILISASHNDYRYNGYKLSCSNGSQFDPEERDEMYNKYIVHAKTKDIRLCSFADAPLDKLWFLGGEEPVDDFDYMGREDHLINIHEKHREHVKSFLLTPNLADQQQAASDALHIGYCAFHGVGRRAIPRLLAEVGFEDIKPIHENGLNDLNGLFPSFNSAPGKEQQPDPGDPRAAEIAVEAFKEEYPQEAFRELDILIGTDPDADRCGVVVKVPEEQRHAYGGQEHFLLSADDMWTLVLWYRLHREIKRFGAIQDAEKKFITLSHTTTDSVVHLARKHGLGVVKSWVGFAALAAVTRDIWNGKINEMVQLVEGRSETWEDLCHPFACECSGIDHDRSINVVALEQSNGFSILGGPPPDERSLGVGGHVRDKDGTFAALLVAEVAAWAKAQGANIIELLDQHVYLDPDIGLFMTFYEPDPLDGEYPGIQGDRLKKEILRRVLGYFQFAKTGDLEIGGLPVKSSVIYRTGKYDPIYPPTYDYQFPDEGIRFYFDESRLNHVTIRPSGTGNSLRFHIQLHTIPTENNLIAEKIRLRNQGKAIMHHLRELLKAPRK